MNPVDFVRTVAWAIATIISVPLLVALVRASMFFGAMAKTVEQLQRSLKDFVSSVDRRFEDQGVAIEDHTEKLAVLWDGHTERRGGIDRRSHGD